MKYPYKVPVSATLTRYHEQAKENVTGELTASLVLAHDSEEAKKLAGESLLEQNVKIGYYIGERYYIGEPLRIDSNSAEWQEHVDEMRRKAQERFNKK